MNKVKYLSIISTILLFLNVGLIIFIFLHRPGAHGPHGSHGPMHGPRNIIIEKLDFDEQQVKIFDEKIKWHQNEMIRTQNELLVLKKSLYSNLNKTQNVALTDSIVHEINIVQNQIEHINYKHFEDIKSICKTEQLKKFEKLTTELADLFSPPKRRPIHKED